jgi:soluble lytic murein transglycosylase-like protein
MRYFVRFAFSSAVLLASLVPMASQASANSGQYAALIATHARANGIPVELASAVVRHESNYNPRVTGRAGEIGLMQIKLQTARGLGYRGTRKGLYDPATNIAWGMKYLGQARQLAGGSECGTLSRYNGGLGTKRMIKGYCRQVASHIVSRQNGKTQVVRVASVQHAVRKGSRQHPVDTAAASAPKGGFFQLVFASAQ